MDLGPYTVEGMEAKDAAMNGEEHGAVPSQDYTLVGVTVHSGQAAGGHYYSFIRDRCTGMWYRFDDSEVKEYQLTDANMAKDFFGGTYRTTVWDPQQQRNVPREKERWWNAYLLFYERTDRLRPDKVTQMTTKLPPLMDLTVQDHNLRFQHRKELYNKDFFDFVFRLCVSNTLVIVDQASRSDLDEALLRETVNLTLRFFIDYVLKVDVAVRGTAQPWLEIFIRLLSAVPQVWEVILKEFSSLEFTHTVFLACSDESVRRVVCHTIITIINTLTKNYGPEVATAHGEAYFKVTIGTLLESRGSQISISHSCSLPLRSLSFH